MKDVLIITDVDFWVGGAGHRVRINEMITFLAQSCKLCVVFIGHAEINLSNALEKKMGISFYPLGIVPNGEIKEYGQRLREKVNQLLFDTIIVEYIHNTIFLKYIDVTSTCLILDAHDIISERTDMFRSFNYSSAIYEMSEDLEFKLMDVYDYIIVLCEPDYIRIASVFGKEKTLLCSHAVIPTDHILSDEVKNLGFVASEYAPNIDAINNFLYECWPFIVANFQVNLHIYGNICKMISIDGIKNVSKKGYVASVKKIYDSTDIIINPVRFGAGLKIKNIEALSHGLPLVTTSHGARGLETAINEAFLVANSPQEFFRCISALINQRDLRTKLGKNAHKLIQEKFSPQKCFASLIDVIND